MPANENAKFFIHLDVASPGRRHLRPEFAGVISLVERAKARERPTLFMRRPPAETTETRPRGPRRRADAAAGPAAPVFGAFVSRSASGLSLAGPSGSLD